MPAKKKDDLDSFLDDFDAEDAVEAPAETVDDLVPVDEFQTSFEEDFVSVEDEEDAEIARLKAELSTPTPRLQPKKNVRPKPESQLTEKEKQIRDLQDQLARKRTAELESADADYDDEEGETFLIHFVEDGLTAFGQVWFRGQELEFHVDGDDYAQTVDLEGNSWLEQTEDQQIDRYGKVVFRRGPWRGKRLNNEDISDIARITEGTITREEQRRARRVPLNL